MHFSGSHGERTKVMPLGHVEPGSEEPRLVDRGRQTAVKLLPWRAPRGDTKLAGVLEPRAAEQEASPTKVVERLQQKALSFHTPARRATVR